MLVSEGNMQQRKDCQHQIVFDNVEDDLNMVASLEITQLEQKAIEAHLVENEEHFKGVTMTTIPRAANNISSTLRSISNTLVDHDFSWHGTRWSLRSKHWIKKYTSIVIYIQ